MTSKQERVEQIYLETALFLNRNFLSDKGQIARDYLKSRGLNYKFMSNYVTGYTDFSDKAFVFKYLIQKFDIIDLLDSKIVVLKQDSGNIIDYFPINSIVFPLFREGKITSFSARLINSNNKFKYKTLKYNRVGIFNIDIIKKHKIIYLVEGAIDSLTLNYIRYPSIGILGLSSLGLENAEPLRNYSGKIVMCFDNENNGSGSKAINRVGNILSSIGVKRIYYKILPKEKEEEKVDLNYLLNKLGPQKTKFLFGKLPLIPFVPTEQKREYKKREIQNEKEPNLVELVSRHTTLTKISSGYSCRCPLPGHDDKTPSFVVYPDNRFHCYGCLPKGQRVWTTNGAIDVSDIKVGMSVIDAEGMPTKVTNVQKHIQNMPILKILTSTDNKGLLATANHDMLWVPSPTYSKKNVPKKIAIKTNCKKIDRMYTAELRHLDPGTWVPTSAIRQAYTSPVFYGATPAKCGGRNIGNIDITDPDFSYMLGLFAAEGWIANSRVVFFSIHEKEVVKFMEKLSKWTLPNLGILPSAYKDKDSNGATLAICSVELATIISNLVGCGCDKKICPDEIIRGPIRTAAAFLAGLFDGDGCKKNHSLTLTSRPLIESAQAIAIRCGAFPSIWNHKQYKNKKIIYGIGFLYNSIEKIYNWYNGTTEKLEPEIHKDVCFIEIGLNSWYMVSRIKSTYTSKKLMTGNMVWDITTESGTFTTTSLSVHNCSRGGGPYQFLMDFKNITFKEAKKELEKE